MRFWTIPLTLLVIFSINFTAEALIAAELPEIRGVKPIDKTKHIRSESKPDKALEKAIIQSADGYSESASDSSSLARYYYNRVDLNGDNKPEVIVHLVGSYFCGTGGCTTLIFKTVGGNYRLVSSISVSSTPIIVSNQKIAGWNNLILLAVGGGRNADSGYYLLRFNGKQYPLTPDDGTKLRRNTTITGTYLMSDIDTAPGLVLKP